MSWKVVYRTSQNSTVRFIFGSQAGQRHQSSATCCLGLEIRAAFSLEMSPFRLWGVWKTWEGSWFGNLKSWMLMWPVVVIWFRNKQFTEWFLGVRKLFPWECGNPWRKKQPYRVPVHLRSSQSRSWLHSNLRKYEESFLGRIPTSYSMCCRSNLGPSAHWANTSMHSMHSRDVNVCPYVSWK